MAYSVPYCLEKTYIFYEFELLLAKVGHDFAHLALYIGEHATRAYAPYTAHKAIFSYKLSQNEKL